MTHRVWIPSVLLALVASGCAPRYTLVDVQPVGPVQVEIWHDKQRQQCERRVYLGSDYHWAVVPCPA